MKKCICRKKVLITATIGSFLGWFEVNDIKLLQELGYEVHCACNMEVISTEERRKNLETSGAVIHHIPFSRSPLSLRNVRCYKELKMLIKKEKFNLIHCHTPVGGALTRIAAANVKIDTMKIIYTAHGFHFYSGAPLKNWMIYYPIEWLLSWKTDVLITINREDFKRATRHLHARENEYIPGVGIDMSKFSNGIIDRQAKRKELGLNKDDVMLLSVGELSERKNQKVVIEALAMISDRRIHYFLCGKGMLKEQLYKIAREKGVGDRVHFLGYRTDISELCQAADLFVHPSFQEGLPVSLMEAIACRVPVVCSDIRGNVDLVKNKVYCFNPSSALMVRESISAFLINRNNIDSYVEENYSNLKHYDIKSVQKRMLFLYQKYR